MKLNQRITQQSSSEHIQKIRIWAVISYLAHRSVYFTVQLNDDEVAPGLLAAQLLMDSERPKETFNPANKAATCCFLSNAAISVSPNDVTESGEAALHKGPTHNRGKQLCATRDSQ